jgi:predicted Rossmann fold nucleotide-binding protein DprA/Smf involved in DNA uptake
MPELGDEAERVLEALADAPAGVDELVHGTGLDAATVATALAELELAGAIMEAEGLYRGVGP